MKALALAALALVPASAQSLPKWNGGLQFFGPTLEGHYQEFKTNPGDTANSFDFQKDLGLGKDGSKPGLFLEYQGPRFGLALSYDMQDYKGSQRLSRPVEIDGTTFQANGTVNTTMKVGGADLAWTIRCYRWEQAWVGVDLGLHAWLLDVKANGQALVSQPGLPPVTETRSASAKLPLPIPQIGLSGGGHFLEGRGVVRGSWHFLSYKGASYTRIQADARYYFLDWLGARVFVDQQTFDIPKGSIQNDVEAKLDRKGVGFGLVARW